MKGWLDGKLYRIKLTVAGSFFGGYLYDMSELPPHFWDTVKKSDYTEMKLTTSDGVTRVDAEMRIEKKERTGMLAFWVNMGESEFYLYYGVKPQDIPKGS